MGRCGSYRCRTCTRGSVARYRRAIIGTCRPPGPGRAGRRAQFVGLVRRPSGGLLGGVRVCGWCPVSGSRVRPRVCPRLGCSIGTRSTRPGMHARARNWPRLERVEDKHHPPPEQLPILWRRATGHARTRKGWPAIRANGSRGSVPARHWRALLRAAWRSAAARQGRERRTRRRPLHPRPSRSAAWACSMIGIRAGA